MLCLRLREDKEAQFCLLTLAMLAGGTTSWSHYMVLAIFPVAAMVTRVSANPSWARVLLFTAAVMALDNVDAPTSAFPEGWHLAKLLWIYTPLFGQLALAAMFVIRPAFAGTRSPHLEAAHYLEQIVPLFDFRLGERLESGETEIFHAIRGNHAAVNDGVAQASCGRCGPCARDNP